MIQSASLKHLEQILEIENMVFNYPWSRNQIENDLKCMVNVENIVFLNNGDVIGYVLGRIIDDEFHLNNIAVNKNYQSNNIGKFMIENLCIRLKNKCITTIYLEVSINNKPAQKLYDSFGFKQDGLRKDYYSIGNHALLFNLKLESYG